VTFEDIVEFEDELHAAGAHVSGFGNRQPSMIGGYGGILIWNRVLSVCRRYCHEDLIELSGQFDRWHYLSPTFRLLSRYIVLAMRFTYE